MWRALVPRLRGVTSSLRTVTSSLTSRTSGSDRCMSSAASSSNESRDASQGPLPSEADVVVIGGGSLGCSTLYHLAKEGVNAVLVEKDDLTAGTTWHTAGLCWRLMPSDTAIQIISHTRHLMMTLEEETGVDPGWINNGGVFIASNKQRLDEYKRMASLGRSFGIESFVLSPAETLDLYPLMNVSDIYGVLYSPGDGTMDPAGYCAALTRSATRNGAKLFTKTSVVDITTEVDQFGAERVTSVVTDRGTIKTKAVANCGGAWAPQISAHVGVKTPIIPMKHAYVVTERIDGIQNMPNVRDHDASVYLKLQGDALCVGGYEPNPHFIDDLPTSFAFGLYELDWDVFMVHVEGAINRVPKIEQTGIKSTVCGPESFTPDHKALLGESPEVRGFYLGAGFNSAGMMLGGGSGQQLARWIVNGRPDIDMFSYDIRRFCPKLTDDRAWVKSRSHETYAKNYSILFPHDEPLSGRNMRHDALYQTLLDEGCIYQERHGWERPGWYRPDKIPTPAIEYDYYGNYGNTKNADYAYRDVLETEYTFDFPPHHDVIGTECLTCREKAALFNMSYFGKFYLVGPDASKAADWLFTANMRKPDGSTVYTCMCNKKGGAEADLTVSVLHPGEGGPHSPKFDGVGYYLAVGGAAAQQNLSHVTTEIQDHGWDVTILDHTDHMGLMSLQGPLSREILQSVCPDTDFSDEAFPFSTHKVVNIAGHECRAMRLSFVGEMGWELHTPNESCVPVYQAVMKAGGPLGLVNSGYRAIDSLSIEKGYRHWHADLKADDTPLEAGLGFTCKLKTDIPFLGREALEQQKSDGIRRKLVCFTIDEHVPLFGMETIFRDGQVVGYLARAEYAFALGKSIGYGYVRDPAGGVVNNAFIKAGAYQIESMSEMYSAHAHVTSPFDPKNQRVKGIYDEPIPIRMNGERKKGVQ